MDTFEFYGIELNINEITIDDMPTKLFREIYELCGASTAISLLRNMPANIIQVPANGLKNIIKKRIVKEYDYTTESLRLIARKYKIPEVNVRKILQENRVDVPVDGQKSFDFYGQKNAE